MKMQTGIKVLATLTGVPLLLSGCAETMTVKELESPTPGMQVKAQAYKQLSSPLIGELSFTKGTFQKVANVSGAFSFAQDAITPNDQIFNLFGAAVTATTGVCAVPGFVFDSDEQEAVHFINVGGDLEKSYSVDLNELKGQKSETKIAKCTCGTGGAIANASITGIPLSAVIEMADLKEGVNTVTFRGEDGYGIPMPLSFALENDTMLVYKLNGEDLPTRLGGPAQAWVPGAVAQYFTRKVMDIELTAEPEEPKLLKADEAYQTKINILNYTDGKIFALGQEITFEGYADDSGVPIASIEFSMDGGKTWTAFKTPDATLDKWVYWSFTTTPEAAGDYQLMVRTQTADGAISPLGSTLQFTVEKADLQA